MDKFTGYSGMYEINDQGERVPVDGQTALERWQDPPSVEPPAEPDPEPEPAHPTRKRK